MSKAPSTSARKSRDHVFLIDGSSYIFRAYHRLPPLTDPQGTPVGAVYGYTTMLWKLAEDLHKADGPTHLAVILDKAGTSFRNEIYEHYKANRPPPPEDLQGRPLNVDLIGMLAQAQRAVGVAHLPQAPFGARLRRGQRSRGLRLADSRWTQEKERPDRSIWVGDA